MRRKSIKLYNKNEYAYKIGHFIPTINAYLHEDDYERPAIVIVPGGGYEFVSATEAYIVALSYYHAGYQAYVLTYTVNTLRKFRPLGLQPLKDLSRAVCEVRKRANQDHVNKNKIAIIGFSAGGHLAGSLAVHYRLESVKHEKDVGISNRPDAVVLSYPVITSGKHAHVSSFEALLGKDATVEELERMSLEKQITNNTPPVFLWHTVTDSVVSVDNSILFMQACAAKKVPCEMHIYPQGPHGLSVANEAWKNHEIGDSYYVFEQMLQDFNFLNNNSEEMPTQVMTIRGENTKQFAKAFYKYTKNLEEQDKAGEPFDESVSQWLELSVRFLDKVWRKII